jgi:hypothetical protein
MSPSLSLLFLCITPNVIYFFNASVMFPTYNHSQRECLDSAEGTKHIFTIKMMYHFLWSIIQISSIFNCKQFVAQMKKSAHIQNTRTYVTALVAVRTQTHVCILLKHGRHFYYWNQPLNMHVRVCYLHCIEAGLCCYLVIKIENILRQLRLLYFHLCPIYRLFIVEDRY